MKILAVLAAAIAGIGATIYRKREKKGLRVDKRYRGQVKRAMDEVERVAPMKFKDDNIRLTTPKAEKVVNGLPVFWVESEQMFVGGHWSGGGRIAVALDANGNIHNGVLIHELWHVLLGQHGVALREHHGIMRRYRVFLA